MSDAGGVQLRPILILWEKLRIAYNVVLAGVTLFMLALNPAPLSDPRFPRFLAMCWIVANICYTAGPTVEAYVNYVAGRRVRLTWVLFGVGMIMSIFLAFAAMLDFGMADWD